MLRALVRRVGHLVIRVPCRSGESQHPGLNNRLSHRLTTQRSLSLHPHKRSRERRPHARRRRSLRARRRPLHPRQHRLILLLHQHVLRRNRKRSRSRATRQLHQHVRLRAPMHQQVPQLQPRNQRRHAIHRPFLRIRRRASGRRTLMHQLTYLHVPSPLLGRCSQSRRSATHHQHQRVPAPRRRRQTHNSVTRRPCLHVQRARTLTDQRAQASQRSRAIRRQCPRVRRPASSRRALMHPRTHQGVRPPPPYRRSSPHRRGPRRARCRRSHQLQPRSRQRRSRARCCGSPRHPHFHKPRVRGRRVTLRRCLRSRRPELQVRCGARPRPCLKPRSRARPVHQARRRRSVMVRLRVLPVSRSRRRLDAGRAMMSRPWLSAPTEPIRSVVCRLRCRTPPWRRFLRSSRVFPRWSGPVFWWMKRMCPSSACASTLRF